MPTPDGRGAAQHAQGTRRQAMRARRVREHTSLVPPARHGQPTLEEVAAIAGVSRATVSRVVNDSPKVSPEAKAAVDSAIAMLGYVPNRAARSLVTRRTDTVGLVVSEPESRVFSDPFFAASIRGISTALATTNLQLVLLLAQNGPDHEKVSRYVRQGHVDGVILMSLHGDDPMPDLLRTAGVPTVLSGRPPAGQHVPYVDADNRGGARQATEHLIARGCQRIATITGPLDMRAAVDRYDGYRDALRAAGRPLRKSLVAHGDFGESSGAQAMAALLRREPKLDGVFIANDPMSFGALRTLEASGRHVPADVAVVGFDDVPFAADAMPPLTTVHQPLDDMTRAMIDLLRRHIDGGGSPDDAVVCPTRLIRRASA